MSHAIRAGKQSPDGTARPQGGLALGALVLLAFFGAGCGIGAFDGPKVVNSCSGDSQCVNGRCSLELGRCVSEPAQGLRIGLEVAPLAHPDGGDPTRASFAEIDVDSNAIVDLHLPPRTMVEGNIRHAAEIVAADIAFTKPSAFVGGSPARVRASTAAALQLAMTTGTNDYSVRLIAGATYDVEVMPTGAAIREWPPLRTQYIVPTTDAGRLDIDYPASLEAPCASASDVGCTIEGTVTSVAADLSRTPENGLQVRAVESSTGRVVSSTALTQTDLGAGDGFFRLRLAPDAGAYALRVSGSVDQPHFPTVDIDPATLDFAAVEVELPRLSVTQVSGVIVDERLEPVVGALVTLTSTTVSDPILALDGSFRANTETIGTNTSGSFELNVLPGDYEIVVTPTGDADLALYVGDVIVPATALHDIGLISVPNRTRLGGLLQVATGEPLAEALIVARTQGIDSGYPASAHNRSSESYTDATGRFDLPLDIGLFDLSLRPPADTYFPWTVALNFGVEEASETMVQSFEVDYPVPVIGRVFGPDGSALPQAEIRAYAITDEMPPRAIPVGVTSSGDDGRYLLLLPPQLK